MSKLLQLPRCPYCHKRISYIGSAFMKTKGEHNCGSCKCISNVVISKTAYAIASLVCIAALLIVLLYSMSGDHGSFLGIAAVLAPFLIFYILVPFFVRLEPCKDQSAVKKILERNASNRPDDSAYQAAANSASRPVMLDVEDDFSAKFMQAKHRNSQKSLEENDRETDLSSAGDIEDIGNTKIAFEINHELGFEAESSTLPTEQENTSEPEPLPESEPENEIQNETK